MNVDWRNRFGYNWISSVRNQGNTNNCWAFAMTALYESMVRIEHCLWCRLSEGEVARGAGKQSRDFGNLGEAAIFAERYGVADPDCFPWSESMSIYLSKPHGTSMDAFPISTTPDRSGRVVKVKGTTSLQIVADKKNWIDTRGPMSFMINLPPDFAAHGTGIYTPAGATTSRQSHAMLVVGFSDTDRCWIVKNSWGARRNEAGFIRISYDANILEPLNFVGMAGTNPGPWIKRRHRNGNIIQGGNGARRNNLELFLWRGQNIEHWWREHSIPGFPWNRVGVVASTDPWRGIEGNPIDMPSCIQSTFNRNYELIYRNSDNRLRHIYYDQKHAMWFDCGPFGPTNPVGVPGFIQSNRGAPGDFEVIVLNNFGALEHWTKHNSYPWTHRPGEWHQKRNVIGSGIRFAGPALVHSKKGLDPDDDKEMELGQFHYAAVNNSGNILHFISFTPNLSGSSWQVRSTFGSGILSAPCMIETQGNNDEKTPGTLELCVVNNAGVMEHWTCNRTLESWTLTRTIGTGLVRVVGLLQSTFNFNLEAIVERTDGRFQHFHKDIGQWHAGVIIV